MHISLEMKLTRQINIQIYIIRMVEFLIDNIYVEFGGHVYHQTVGIQMGTNCAPLVADVFLYSYEADYVQHLQKSKFESLNNPKFNDYIDVIYPKELEIKNTPNAPKWDNYGTFI